MPRRAPAPRDPLSILNKLIGLAVPVSLHYLEAGIDSFLYTHVNEFGLHVGPIEHARGNIIWTLLWLGLRSSSSTCGLLRVLWLGSTWYFISWLQVLTRIVYLNSGRRETFLLTLTVVYIIILVS